MGAALEVTRCEVCGNDYDKAFLVVHPVRGTFFDSFECAIHALAPACAHCGCPVVGHGVEAGGSISAVPDCAGSEGVAGLRDRGRGDRRRSWLRIRIGHYRQVRGLSGCSTGTLVVLGDGSGRAVALGSPRATSLLCSSSGLIFTGRLHPSG